MLKKNKKDDLFLNGKDSKEEVYVDWYLQELKDAGIIKDCWCHPEVYDLTNPVMQAVIQTKGRGKNKHEILTTKQFKSGHTYKPDFRIRWSSDSEFDAFTKTYSHVSESNVSVTGGGYFYRLPYGFSDIDVKPVYQINDASQAKFSLIQSIVLNKYKVFVQPVVYQDLFAKTFTPKRFLQNDSGKKYRFKLINGAKVFIKDLPETVSLDQFLSGWVEPKF